MRLSPDNFVARLIRLATFLVAAVLLSGCDLQDMYRQPKTEPYMSSSVFADGTSARPLEADTVARGHLRTNEVLYTGKLNGKEVDTLPFPVTKAVLLRGQERFDIFCSPCHDRAGNGNGMIVQRGYRRPPPYHTPQMRAMALGHFFDVISNGFGVMPDYAAQIPAEDRWAIAAYVRTLQFSQYAPLADVPAGERQKLKEPVK